MTMAPAMTTDALPIVECASFDPRQRGRAHGEALRAVIAAKIERWHAAIETEYRAAPKPFLARFLADTRFRSAIERYTPDLMDEVQGIADGAAIDADTAYALQLMDEEWWFGHAAHDGHCSGVAIAPAFGAATVMGQTMDLPAWHDGAQAVLRFGHEDGSHTMVFTSAGMIGLMGACDQGIGICVNTLAGLNPSPDGLPVAFVMRGALARKDVVQAAQFLTTVPHASGQNYLIGDRNTVRGFECSSAGASELPVSDGKILHTNHPLASTDLRKAWTPGENSKARLAALDAECAASQARDANHLMTALASRRDGAAISMARTEQTGHTHLMTVGGAVYEIGATTRMWVSGGPTTVNGWRQISFDASA